MPINVKRADSKSLQKSNLNKGQVHVWKPQRKINLGDKHICIKYLVPF